MKSVTTAADIWSVGCLAIELLTGAAGGCTTAHSLSTTLPYLWLCPVQPRPGLAPH